MMKLDNSDGTVPGNFFILIRFFVYKSLKILHFASKNAFWSQPIIFKNVHQKRLLKTLFPNLEKFALCLLEHRRKDETQSAIVE